MCASGIKCKFDQNPKLKLSLLKTDDKAIIECSADEVLGTGIPINDEQALDKDRWINQGILGEILEEDSTPQENNIEMEETTAVD